MWIVLHVDCPHRMKLHKEDAILMDHSSGKHIITIKVVASHKGEHSSSMAECRGISNPKIRAVVDELHCLKVPSAKILRHLKSTVKCENVPTINKIVNRKKTAMKPESRITTLHDINVWIDQHQLLDWTELRRDDLADNGIAVICPVRKCLYWKCRHHVCRLFPASDITQDETETY